MFFFKFCVVLVGEVARVDGGNEGTGKYMVLERISIQISSKEKRKGGNDVIIL